MGGEYKGPENRSDPYGYYALQTMIEGLATSVNQMKDSQKQLFDLIRDETKARETLTSDFKLCNQKGSFETKQANERIERVEGRVKTLEDAPEKAEEKKNSKTIIVATVAGSAGAVVAVIVDLIFRALPGGKG